MDTSLDSLCVPDECQNQAPLFNSRPIICGIGTATSPFSYSQGELLEFFRVKDRRVRSLFLNSAIERRYLTLPPVDGDGCPLLETQGELLNKHRNCSLELGARAIRTCLENARVSVADISYLCCTTTTGFLTPGLTAFFCRDLKLREDCVRLDVVGMGCNAGLNALSATAAWAHANPGKLAVMLCVETCSAAYVFDGTMRTAVVNSLFGDGAAAVAVTTKREMGSTGPEIQKFSSLIITEAIEAMRFDWDDSHGKFSFFLDPDIPYVIGANVEKTITTLLRGTGIRQSEIAHWVVHSGGKKVIDALRVNLGLSAYDLRHTTGVLRDYGNLSSGSFLFSYQRLIDEDKVTSGDYGIMISMGPGSTIESALIKW
ncbi:3,5-dihydroxyphenylacetyl-CoA synthase DpgA [Granulicella sp. L60]|uniref:3,5-dihydroxyphenylacetyl-CoA synthase DpgA n=1 Tax=Granulicella sp. L60 TaxID=1641866 RepID=UPI00131E98B4|nr:3,5-dihydroxyphenylacetyl-CoA synthase DpgA [Granulicella sp. L60]